MPPAAAGLGSRFHAVPFQCRIKIPALVWPTAQAFVADVAATPWSCASGGLGLGTRFHAMAFQCTIRVSPPLVPPTAHPFRAEVGATPARKPDTGKDALGPEDRARGCADSRGSGETRRAQRDDRCRSADDPRHISVVHLSRSSRSR
jgi:hypothetical protein